MGKIRFEALQQKKNKGSGEWCWRQAMLSQLLWQQAQVLQHEHSVVYVSLFFYSREILTWSDIKCKCSACDSGKKYAEVFHVKYSETLQSNVHFHSQMFPLQVNHLQSFWFYNYPLLTSTLSAQNMQTACKGHMKCKEKGFTASNHRHILSAEFCLSINWWQISSIMH